MEQRLLSEIPMLYSSEGEAPHTIRFRIRMKDPIDPALLRRAVDRSMERYPYFCVALQRKDGEYVFARNPRPVAIGDAPEEVVLNTEASHHHMIAFSHRDDRLFMDLFHGLTDGIGGYRLLRSLLQHYCRERYGSGPEAGVAEDRTLDPAAEGISPEEWEDPLAALTCPPPAQTPPLPEALRIVEKAGLGEDRRRTVYGLTIRESELVRFSMDKDGSPATMISLFLSRALRRLFPKEEDPIRIALCLNQRKALGRPMARQSLVGMVMLEYKEQMRDAFLEELKDSGIRYELQDPERLQVPGIHLPRDA